MEKEESSKFRFGFEVDSRVIDFSMGLSANLIQKSMGTFTSLASENILKWSLNVVTIYE